VRQKGGGQGAYLPRPEDALLGDEGRHQPRRRQVEVDRRWIVHPFLFEVREPARIRTDWEHTETRWIQPRDIFQYETVPQLAEALGRVYALPRA